MVPQKNIFPWLLWVQSLPRASIFDVFLICVIISWEICWLSCRDFKLRVHFHIVCYLCSWVIKNFKIEAHVSLFWSFPYWSMKPAKSRSQLQLQSNVLQHRWCTSIIASLKDACSQSHSFAITRWLHLVSPSFEILKNYVGNVEIIIMARVFHNYHAYCLW